MIFLNKDAKKINDRENNEFDNKIDIELEQTKKSKLYTVKINKDGKGIYVHSKYDPIRESENLVCDINVKKKEAIIVIGLGLGYHIQALAKKLDKSSQIVVIEPSKKMFDLFVESGAYKEISKHENIFYIVGDDFKEMIIDFERLGFYYENINILNMKAYEQLFAEYITGVYEQIKKYISKACLDRNTNLKAAMDMTKNVIKNMKVIAKSTNINEFENVFKESTAIVVSAGPSLAKNINKLKSVNGKAIIISGGRTLKQLVDLGVDPNFVVSIDMFDNNYEYVYKNICDYKVPMVCPWLNSNKVTNRYEGEKVIFSNLSEGNFDTKFFNQKIGDLNCFGTIATAQIDLARHLGCKNIILVGQDLAYTDDKAHYDKSATGDNKVSRDGLFKVKGNTEEFVYTNEVLNSYKVWIENYAKLMDVNIINATEGGAFIENTDHMTFDESVKFVEDSKIYDFDSIIKEKMKIKMSNDENITAKNIKQCIFDIKEYIKLEEKSIEICQKIKGSGGNDSLFKKLQKNNKAVDKQLEKVELLNIISKELVYIYNKIDMDELKKVDEVMNASIKYYEEGIRGAKQIKEILEEELCDIGVN